MDLVMLKCCLRIWILFSCALVAFTTNDQQRKVYIAYMGSLPKGDQYSPSAHHSQIIKEVVDPRFASKAIVRSYTKSFNGFAANLTEAEYKKLTRKYLTYPALDPGYQGMVSVFPCRKLNLQTTRSWDFMGFSKNIERVPTIESDIVIGVIDSGIWPESESFNDEMFRPIPAKWKGVCNGGKYFTCNRKIIGARTYSVDPAQMDFSARDMVGHGTHSASIAAGNKVSGVSYYGLGQGLARGGVPSARIAVYKVCNPDCYMTDIMSAFHDAVYDGVDIISISINQNVHVELLYDPIAIGSFHAVEKGVLTVNPAGNNGPKLYSIGSYAPWLFMVGASDVDRRIMDKLLLGNEAVIKGNGINAFQSSDQDLPIVSGKEVTTLCSEIDSRNCITKCLQRSLVEGKVVLCEQYPDMNEVHGLGARGWITPNFLENNHSGIMSLPIVAISKSGLQIVQSYINSTMAPKVRILKSEVVANPGAPFVAMFSARGPSRFLSDIIKPDVTAPGVEILAAFSPSAPPSLYKFDKRSVRYNILSGTSMACPHVAGAAAYVKSFHPEWSPSAIKSALMTTAWEFKGVLPSEAEFAYGSGHIQPVKAIDPGLVYETFVEEYTQIWCNIPNTDTDVTRPRDRNVTCPSLLTAKEINYPSMAVLLEMKKPVLLEMKKRVFSVSFPRTVTNVGQANSTYISSIEGSDSELDIRVEPATLHFSELNQKMPFVVTVKGKRMKTFKIKRMALVWTDGIHRVRSPIVLYTMQTTSDGKRVATTSKFHLATSVILLITILL